MLKKPPEIGGLTHKIRKIVFSYFRCPVFAFSVSRFSRTNASGTPVNGYLLTLVLVAILIMLPTLGIGDMNNLYKWLLNLNSVVMPLRYLWVFVAFIAVIRLAQKYKPEYVFIRNRALALTVGIWCFAFTAFACLTGIFPKMEAFTPEWTFQLTLNIVTPFVLVGLGLIFPLLARRNT